MKNNKKKNRRSGMVLPLIIAMLIWAIIGYIGVYHIVDSKVGYWFLLFIFICLSLFLHVIIHEAGHLVCGLISGYRFVSFRIGSLIIAKRGDRIEFCRFSLMGTGGQCLMSPPDLKEGQMPYKLYNIGGVLFNFLTVGLFFVIWKLIVHGTLFAAFCMLMMLFGMLFGLMNGIPLQAGGIDNDGRNVFSLGKHPESMRALWLQLKVNELQTNGVRLKDMPEEWFQFPEDWPLDNSICVSTAVMACNRAMDQLAFAAAEERAAALVNGTNKLIPFYLNTLKLELIFTELIGQNRKEVLEGLRTKEFEKYAVSMKNSPPIIRMQYACELLENHDENAAQKQLDLFEKTAKNYVYKGDLESEREIMAYVSTLYKRRKGLERG